MRVTNFFPLRRCSAHAVIHKIFMNTKLTFDSQFVFTSIKYHVIFSILDPKNKIHELKQINKQTNKYKNQELLNQHTKNTTIN